MTHPKVQSAARFTISAIESIESFYRIAAPKVQDAYFLATPVIRDAYAATQIWIEKEAPVWERVISNYASDALAFAVATVINLAVFAIEVCEFIQDDAPGIAEEIDLQYCLLVIKAKRKAVQGAIALVEFCQYNGIDTQIERGSGRVRFVWMNRSSLALAAMDRLFCLG